MVENIAVVALLRAHLETGRPTRKSVGVIYAMLIGNYSRIPKDGWGIINTAIMTKLGITARQLDAVKKIGWDLHKATCERLGQSDGAAPNG